MKRKNVGLPVEGLPPFETVHELGDTAFVSLPPEVVAVGEIVGLSIPGLRRWLALDRPDYYWMRPKVGSGAEFGALQQTQFLLGELGRGVYVLLLPLTAGDLRAYLHGEGETLTLAWDGAAPGAAATEAELLAISTGRDPHELVRNAMATIAARTGTFRTAWEKPTVTPTGLGWCTWDAFYHDVSEARVLEGLRSFAKAGVPLEFCILDDGWLDADGDFLNDFPANPVKFPNGLAPLIATAKVEGLVETFGIWHAFQGYWAGLNPTGPLGRRYRTLKNRGGIRPWKPEEITDLHLVHPDDAARFYGEFHAYLRGQGVDLVKVDGQSATEIFTTGVAGRVGTMRALQYAAQASARLHFDGRMIHCMSHGSDVIYSMLGTTLFRNSDDYFPKRPESHGRHIYLNAMNALWTHTVGTPDWDMFWSGHREGAFHAAARAISGGPVYVSDPPGQQDATILRKLLDGGRRLLAYDNPALPAVDSLFADATTGDAPLKITNVADHGGVVGLFNCRQDGPAVGGEVRATDIVDLEPGKAYVAWFHVAQRAVVVKPAAALAVSLEPLTFELVHYAELHDGLVASLGLVEKYASSASVMTFQTAPREYAVQVLGNGLAVFYCTRKPKKVATDRKSKISWDARAKLLAVACPGNGDGFGVSLTF